MYKKDQFYHTVLEQFTQSFTDIGSPFSEIGSARAKEIVIDLLSVVFNILNQHQHRQITTKSNHDVRRYLYQYVYAQA
jgi:hypothetical protein